ncbi:MAG: TIGR01777 family oxidoreductase [Vicinamibacterales bacterium]
MRVFVTGATGFIGRALIPRLQRDGHSVIAWVRSEPRARGLLGADVVLVSAQGGAEAMTRALAGCDAVVNLAGEPILGGRWTAARRAVLERSRVGVTEDLVRAIAAAGPQGPKVLVSGSAVGWYGDRADQVLTETSARGDDFLSHLCERWESAALKAEDQGVRVVVLRTGVVLGRAGGALAQMLPPFRFGAGGPVGFGRQYFPWIHLHDLVNIIAVALTDARYRGPLNAAAPEEATSRVFAKTLGRALHRPALLPVPALALRAMFGQAATVLLGSQRVQPRQLLMHRFAWDFPELDAALRDLVDDRAATIATAKAPEGTADARYELRARIVVDAPLKATFAFFSAAANLGLLTPAAMKFSIQGAAPSIAAGTTIDYRIWIGPVPVRWRTRITAWEPGRRFVDVQEIGPYRVWKHEHTFRADGTRTVMEDRVWYAPPLGVLGRIAHRLFIASALRGIFQYRSDVIRLRFGAEETLPC